MNNYGEGKPKKVEVQSEMYLADMFGMLHDKHGVRLTDDAVEDFWNEIDLVCPEYDCNNDEISMIHGPY